jgi:hypothetical protein
MTVGTEVSPAVVCTPAADSVLSGEIPGVHFSSVNSSLSHLREEPTVSYHIRRAVTDIETPLSRLLGVWE